MTAGANGLAKKDWTVNNPFIALLRELIMFGSINTKDKCPVCLKKFSQQYVNQNGIYCPKCLTKPNRYFLSLKSVGLGQMHSDPRTKQVFETYKQSLETLIAINRDYKEAQQNGRQFDIKNWKTVEIEKKLVKNICEQRMHVYEVELGKGKKTKTRVNNVKKSYRYISSLLGDKDIRSIESEDVEKFYLDLVGHNLSSRYIRDILDELKALFLRYRSQDIPVFPSFEIVPTQEKQFLGFTREFSILEKVPHRHSFRLAIQILLSTGMRINEVVALKKHNLVDGRLVVDKAISDGKMRFCRKAGLQVVHRLSNELVISLEKHCEGLHDDDFIFSISGIPFKTSRLYKVWRKAIKDANVKHISLQQASRHSNATRIMREFEDKALAEIQKQLGHHNKTTGLRHYVIAPS